MVAAPSQIPLLAPDMQAGKFPGGCLWAVQFRLPVAAASNGFIVQEVQFSEIGTNSAGGKQTTGSRHYWEAWPVTKGQTEITDLNHKETVAKFVFDLTKVTLKDPQYQKLYNDVFTNTYAAGSKGRAEWRAVAAFYEVPLPKDFVANNAQTNSGKLLSTTTSPAFWHGSGLMRLFVFDFNFQKSRTSADATLQAGLVPNSTISQAIPSSAMQTAP